MRTAYSYLLCIIVVIVSLRAAQGQETVVISDFDLIRQKVRQIRDVPRLDFDVVTNSETWAVTHFMPRTPGVTPIIQVMRNEPGQRLLVPDGPPEGPLAIGKLKVVALLTPQPKPLFSSYKWTVDSQVQFLKGPPDFERDDKLAYSVFIDGGFAVCQIDPQRTGEARFTPTFPIPAEWQSVVVPAYRAYSADKLLFTTPSLSTSEVEKLRAFLSNGNPLIAVEACQKLNEAGKLDADFVKGSLSKVSGLRQSVFVYLLTRGTLKQPASYNVHFRRPDLADEATRLAKSQNSAGLHDLALGVFSAGVTDAYDPFETPKRVPFKGFGPTLLRAIAQRVRDLKITKPRNQDERELLSLLRLTKAL